MTIKIPVQKEYSWFFNSGDKRIEADTFEQAVELFWQQPENINVSPDYLPSYVHPLEKKFVEIDNKHVPVQEIWGFYNQEKSGEFIEEESYEIALKKSYVKEYVIGPDPVDMTRLIIDTVKVTPVKHEFVEVDGVSFPVTNEMFFGFNKDHETVEGVDYSKVVELYTELYGHDPLPGVVYPVYKEFVIIEDSELA